MSRHRILLLLLAAALLADCAGAASGTPPATTQPTQAGAPTLRAASPAGADPVSAVTEPPSTPAAEAIPATAAPTLPPAPVLTRLTEPGCCHQPYWSPDGQTVLFVDQPDPTVPVGVYGVGVEGGPVERIAEQIGKPSPDGRYLTYLDGSAQVVVREVAAGTEWLIPSDRREVHFSPGSARLAWDAESGTGAFSQRPSVVSVADVNGENAREVVRVYGGGFAGWLEDDRMLVQGRREDASGLQPEALFTLDLNTGEQVTLAESDRIRGAHASPGGAWVAYAITFDPEDASKNGLWVVRPDGTDRQEVEMIGGAQWRDASRLLIIPLEMDAPSHRVVQFDAETGEFAELTDPAETLFRIRAGDWRVSPTGEHIVFVSAEDGAIWSLRLPNGQ